MEFISIIPFQEEEFVIVLKLKNLILQIIMDHQEDLIFIINNLIKKIMGNFISLELIINSIIFSLLGLIILIVSYYIIEKLTPEKTWKEIAEKGNIALAIVLAASILGISLIISAAIHG